MYLLFFNCSLLLPQINGSLRNFLTKENDWCACFNFLPHFMFSFCKKFATLIYLYNLQRLIIVTYLIFWFENFFHFSDITWNIKKWIEEVLASRQCQIKNEASFKNQTHLYNLGFAHIFCHFRKQALRQQCKLWKLSMF